MFVIVANVVKRVIDTTHYSVVMPIDKMYPNYLDNSQQVCTQVSELFRNNLHRSKQYFGNDIVIVNADNRSRLSHQNVKVDRHSYFDF